MTTLKKILPVFKKLTKGKTRPVLQNVLVQNGQILGTDLETNLVIKNNFSLDDGLHVVKTLGLVDGNTEGVEDFPAHRFISEFEDVDSFPMSLELIETLLPFASKDETRLHLNGVAINNGHYVACDGFTLKAIELPCEVGNDYIIPRTSLEILVQLLKKYKIKGDFKCLVNGEHFFIDTPFFTFSTRLILRDYAKWSSVVPTKFTKHATIDQWIDFKELKPLLNTRNNSSRLELKNGEVTLIITGYENNKYIVGHCDKSLNDTIGFNLEYLNRAAGKSKSFNLKFINELCPVMVNDSIVMPLKL